MNTPKVLGLLSALVLVAGCGGNGLDVTPEEQAQATPDVEELATESSALTRAPSCVYETGSSVNGFTNTAYWKIKNGCGSSQWVRLDIPDHADTACKWISPGSTVTFSMTFGGGIWDPMKDYRSIADCRADR